MEKKNIILIGIFLFALSLVGIYTYGQTTSSSSEVSHPADQIKPGSFQTGTYAFPDKVGIGTTKPDYKLDVAGTIRAQDFSEAGGQNLIIGDDTFLTDIDAENMLGIYGMQNSNQAGIRLGANGIYIFGKDGKIGIGKTDPVMTLDVAGNILGSNLYSQGEIKSLNRAQYYSVPIGDIIARNPNCKRNELYYQQKMLFCISGCQRWCSERNYSGGTITEFDPYNNLVGCLCTP